MNMTRVEYFQKACELDEQINALKSQQSAIRKQYRAQSPFQPGDKVRVTFFPRAEREPEVWLIHSFETGELYAKQDFYYKFAQSIDGVPGKRAYGLKYKHLEKLDL